VAALVLLSLAAPPFLSEGSQTVYVLLATAVMVAVGLTLLMGYAGQVSLGQGAFYLVGAYAAGLLSKRGLNPWLALASGPVAAAAVAAAIGLAVLRLRGHYLAFATLAFQLILLTLVAEAKPVTGGDTGIGGFPELLPPIGDPDDPVVGRSLEYCYLAWAAAAAVVALTLNIVRSRPGRGFRALATSEVAAASSGVDVATDKVKVFTVSAAYAGLAGGVYAFFLQFLSPGSFSILLSIQFLVMATVGGTGLVWGAVAGAVLITVVLQALQALASQPGLPQTAPAILSYGLYGAVLVAVMTFLPDGVLPALGRRLGAGAQAGPPVRE
jgi:branched-chain amino acid transport system permease protein